MEKETLIIANELNSRIEKLKAILECFEWNPEDDLGTDSKNVKAVSRNPEIIIEYDADDGNGGRQTIKLPRAISESWIPAIKNDIRSELDVSQREFNKL